jgi:hypothetical protein
MSGRLCGQRVEVELVFEGKHHMHASLRKRSVGVEKIYDVDHLREPVLCTVR